MSKLFARLIVAAMLMVLAGGVAFTLMPLDTLAQAPHQRQTPAVNSPGLVLQKCQPYTTLAPLHAPAMHITILGDSLTQGYGTSIPLRCGFAFQLPMQLPIPIQSGYQMTLAVTAGGGQRVDQMASAAASVALQHPDLALIELGTNDERENTDIAVTQSNYDGILQTLSTATGTALTRPIIACLSIWPSPGFDDPALLHTYDDIIQAECQKFNGTYVDITSIAADKRATDAALNWHPNDYGAQLIAHQIVLDLTSQHRLNSLGVGN